jgi:hypothetical protein
MNMVEGFVAIVAGTSAYVKILNPVGSIILPFRQHPATGNYLYIVSDIAIMGSQNLCR